MAFLISGATMFRSGMFAVASACIALSCVSVAEAKVGVTSVTDGEPLGQPPAASERILRVGIDVQASERVTTKADDRAHVVFLDGTSLTIGPNSVLVIDKYVYDPDRRTGDIALSTTRGVFRFVGGAISKNSEVTVKTPSATIGIRGGIAQIAVAEGGATSANFLYGDAMRVTSQGVTQIANRNGSTIQVPANGPPTKAAIIQRGQMPSTQPLEKRPAAAPLPGPAGARAPVNQNVINQNNAFQQNFVQNSPTMQPTIAPTTTTATTTPILTTAAIAPQTVASIGDSLDKSKFRERNSGLTPSRATLVAAYRPDAKGDGQKVQGNSQRQPTKAGLRPTTGQFKPPPVISKPNPVRQAISNQAGAFQRQFNQTNFVPPGKNK